ncbi:tellurite resistance TerB C-terminal domain-containing protein [Flavobacterium sp. FBOR7N2.3]|uniref:Tellurite resistance TerB C-terminal domain-containing protein n=1 Tax=Flavobacterium magnesitis TaxID=3138077 RepID=A0ABV4TLG7_9FLAO
MMTIFIIAIIIFIIYIASSKDENYKNNNVSSNNNTYKSDQVIRNELIQILNKNIKVSVTITNSLNGNIKDESIIDVTGQSTKINSNIVLVKYVLGIPQWPIQYEYEYKYAEINNASIKQKEFYRIFKNSFLNGIYYDLEGSTNYAFILLNDLQNEYYNHKDLSTLESQFNILGKYYPKTKSYTDSFLSKRREKENILEFKNTNVYSNDNYYDDYWKLGNKFKDKLKLNKEEVKLLNAIYNPYNTFFNIEYCGLEILKLYIAVILALKNKYIQEEMTLDEQFLAVADIIARKQFRYRNGSENYKYCIDTASNAFYSHIFKCSENAVREFYGHKRKLNTDNYYTNVEAKTEFEIKILLKVTELLPTLISKVSQPDIDTEIELYALNTNRWKIKFEQLTSNYNDNPKEFIDSIISLGKLNKKNPSVENIFFEASKFIAKYDKEASLCLYIHYLHHDLKSATFDNKQHTKTIQKSLFKTNEQLHDFEKIISELIKDKDLEKALKQIPEIYKIKRKKIQLNRDSIKEVLEQHSETVELLNEYLKDDFEDENNSIKSQEISNEEIQIEIIQKSEKVYQSAFVSELTFTAIHTTALELFAKSNFSIPQNEFEIFAKSKGVFKNQLIESINDTCYEFLDDVLIEEEDDYYTINTDYFQRISIK